MTPVCPKCGDNMTFDDHVATNMCEYDNARGYMCDNCGTYSYEAYTQEELDREYIRYVHRHNGTGCFTIVTPQLDDRGKYTGLKVEIAVERITAKPEPEMVTVTRHFETLDFIVKGKPTQRRRNAMNGDLELMRMFMQEYFATDVTYSGTVEHSADWTKPTLDAIDSIRYDLIGNKKTI